MRRRNKPQDQPRAARPLLTGKTLTLYDSFASLAKNLWDGSRGRALHPYDYRRFWIFIQHVHRYRLSLTPQDVQAQLVASGFPNDVITDLVNHYTIGRRVLSCEWLPWESKLREQAEAARLNSAEAARKPSIKAPIAHGPIHEVRWGQLTKRRGKKNSA